MKTIFYLFAVLLSVITFPAIAQKSNKVKYGVEVGILPLHLDNFRDATPFSISGFVSGYADFKVVDKFHVKTIVGLHNILTKGYPLDMSGENVNDSKLETRFRNTLEIIIEPRYYLFLKNKLWGNLYGATPFSFETGFFQNNPYNSPFKTPILKLIPTVGYQYNISNNLLFEAKAGLGWSMQRFPSQTFNRFDYSLGVSIGYVF